MTMIDGSEERHGKRLGRGPSIDIDLSDSLPVAPATIDGPAEYCSQEDDPLEIMMFQPLRKRKVSYHK